MNKRINLIIGSGVLGAYLSAELLKKKEKVVVTSRSLKKIYKNYNYLKIEKKVIFEKLNINEKIQISKIVSKYNPKKIFYFAGQSSITKSIKSKQETLNSHYNGTKNFLEILKKEKLNTKFFKSNSGYIFAPKNGLINLKCKFSSNKNPYIYYCFGHQHIGWSLGGISGKLIAQEICANKTDIDLKPFSVGRF